MANYATLKTAIESTIRTNGQEEITGQILQNAIIALIESLGAEFQFAGVASTSTNPGTPDYKVMYIAGAGTYPNFGGTEVEKGHIGVFAYNGSWNNVVVETGAYFEFQEYPSGDAIEFTFYDSENTDGKTIKINKTVSGISNAPDEAISQWWAAQIQRKIQDVQGFTDNFTSLSTTEQSLGLFGIIKTGKVIDSITGVNKLIFIDDESNEYTVNTTDLPYVTPADFVSVKLQSGTASNVSINVRGDNDVLISHININEIADHPAAYTSAALALGDVPTLYRRKGMKVVYYDDTLSLWVEMLNVDDAGANWWTDVTNNWVIEGPIETELPTNTGGQQLRVGGTKRGNLDDVLNVNVWNNQATEYSSKDNARAAVPTNKRKLGAIITYLVSTGTDTSGWMIDEFTGSSISDWAEADNWETIGPVSVSQNTLTIGGEEVGELAGQLIESPEWIWVVTDNGQKIILGFRKSDGAPIFGYGCPPQVVEYITNVITLLQLDSVPAMRQFLGELVTGDNLTTLLAGKLDAEGLDASALSTIKHIYNEDYIEAKTDKNGKILEDITKDGIKEINLPTKIGGATSQSLENQDWIKVDLSSNGKILSGYDKQGRTFIGQFTPETEEQIKEIAGTAKKHQGIIEIPVLDAYFESLLPFVVYRGNVEDETAKGTDAAKYVFDVPFDKSWCVRFKFRITENLLNQSKNAVIARIGNAIVKVFSIPLTQHVEKGTYNGVAYTDNWPTVDGGLSFNAHLKNTLVEGRRIGGQAFSVRYIGNGSAVTLKNTGTAFVLTVDGIDTTYTLSDYDNVSELFEAMSNNTDLVMQYVALDQRTCDELAIFPEISLKSVVHTGVDGSTTITEQVDNAPLYVYYAVSPDWHQAEIFRLGNTIYSVCEGNIYTYTSSDLEDSLTLGGECGVLFKDLVISTNNALDAEFGNDRVISSVNPNIIVLECHGMADSPAYEVTPATTETGMSSINPDTMEYFIDYLTEKGYVPISIDDVADFYAAGKELPKRCYVPIFDDRRWNVLFDNNLRGVLTRHSVKAALAVITGSESMPPSYDGTTITIPEADLICKNQGFGLATHTKTHRYVYQIMPSEYVSFLKEDILDAVKKYVDGLIFVYPGGGQNLYLHDTMEFLGYKCGIEVDSYTQHSSNVKHNRYCISRVNVGRIITTEGESLSPYSDYTKFFI